MIAELISVSGKPLSELVGARMAAYPASGEINRRLDDPREAIARIREHQTGDGIVLLGCGRYAHSRRYIEGLAAIHVFSIERRRHVPIREERGNPVAGYLFVLKVAARETP